MPGAAMINYLSLPIGEGAPDEVNAVIEIPRGQTNKELEAKTTRIVGWRDAGRAREIVGECQARYAKKTS